MNIEAYDLDSLRKLVRELQAENRSLREMLSEKQIPCDINSAFQSDAQAPDDYDPDQASRIIPFSVDDDTARRFYGMFWGRTRGLRRRYRCVSVVP